MYHWKCEYYYEFSTRIKRIAYSHRKKIIHVYWQKLQYFSVTVKINNLKGSLGLIK